MSHPLVGRRQSPEHIAKRMASKQRTGTTQKMIDGARRAAARRVGMRHTEVHKAKISAAMKGKRNALGFKRSEAYRRRLSEYWQDNREKHNHYIDGQGHVRSGLRVAVMEQLEYRLWRERVFKRDQWACQRCGQVGGKLHADHIKPFSLFPDLRFEDTNGRTLCQSCHLSRRTWDAEYAAYGLGRNGRAKEKKAA